MRTHLIQVLSPPVTDPSKWRETHAPAAPRLRFRTVPDETAHLDMTIIDCGGSQGIKNTDAMRAVKMKPVWPLSSVVCVKTFSRRI